MKDSNSHRICTALMMDRTDFMEHGCRLVHRGTPGSNLRPSEPGVTLPQTSVFTNANLSDGSKPAL